MLNLIFLPPIILIINCFSIFTFKKWLGPVGIFYSSIFFIFLSIFILIIDLIYILQSGGYCYIDLGRWFYIYDFIDSRLLFCFDNLSILMSILVLILTSLAQLFGVEYMYREAFISRLVFLLNMFATSVILLFCVYDFFLILLVWELIGLFSFLLVNFYSQRIYTIKASYKTFLFSRISDMFIFIVFNFFVLVFNTLDLSLIFIQLPFYLYHLIFIKNIGFNFITILTLCLSISGCIKAAQFFSHVWLPDAMEAPTPASALIHSSTLVIMGVYAIIRFSIFYEFSPLVNYALALLGSTTIAFGAVTAIFQTDIKKLVAYSTISQIGYLVCGCGFCAYEEVIFYLMIHALNKAFLFIIVGYTVHFFNSDTDFKQMSNIYLYSLDISIFFLTTSLNLIGLPLFAGFYSKEFLLFQVLRDDFISTVVRSFWFISFIFTPIYMFILVFYISFYFKKSLYFLYINLYSIQLNDLNFYLYKTFINLKYSFFRINLFTSRFTLFILLLFWLLFTFLGEFFLLIIFNFISNINFINSNFFYDFNYHIFYGLDVFNFFLTNTFLIFILFISLNSILYILNLYIFNFNKFIRFSYILDFIIIFFNLFLIYFLL